MKLWLSSLASRWNHLLWRLGMVIPILFSQYTPAEEEYEESTSNGWVIMIVSLIVLGLSAWSFFV